MPLASLFLGVVLPVLRPVSWLLVSWLGDDRVDGGDEGVGDVRVAGLVLGGRLGLKGGMGVGLRRR